MTQRQTSCGVIVTDGVNVMDSVAVSEGVAVTDGVTVAGGVDVTDGVGVTDDVPLTNRSSTLGGVYDCANGYTGESGVTTPESRPAVEVTTLKVEPGKKISR